MSGSASIVASKGGPITGAIRVPGDKSVSHRSIIFGSLAQGVTEVSGFLESEDCLATLQAFRDLGVTIEGPRDGKLRIHGVGMHGLQAPDKALDLGNSGTSMRLLTGLFSGQDFDCELVGDASLSKRPMRRVTIPLGTMGAKIVSAEGGVPPLKIAGRSPLQGINYEMPMASAQVKSSLLLAGMYAKGKTQVKEPAPTRDHTERMLQGFAYPVEVTGDTVSIEGGHALQASSIDVPSDISSAAFFMVAASITPGSDLLIRHVGVNPTRIGVINILRLMGADLLVQNERMIGGEPVADVRVRYAQLKGIQVPEDQVPLAIDEFPVLFVAAACAEGQTRLSGAEELRVKESDRIQVMADGLAQAGVTATPTDDGIIIEGAEDLQQPIAGGCDVTSHGDHRIAMSFAVAALRSQAPISIHESDTISTSFPNFVALANQVGFSIDDQS